MRIQPYYHIWKGRFSRRGICELAALTLLRFRTANNSRTQPIAAKTIEPTDQKGKRPWVLVVVRSAV